MKKLYLLFFALLVLSVQAWACSVDFHEQYSRREFSFINIGLLHHMDYARYIDQQPAGYRYVSPPDSLDENVCDWHQWLKSQVTHQAISQAVYDLPVSQVEQALLHVEKKQPLESHILENAMIALLVKNCDVATLRYLVYAKSCEKYGTEKWESEWWDKKKSFEETQQEEAQKKEFIQHGIDHYHKVNAPFLKLRYAFQVVRLLYYAQEWQRCAEVYYDLFSDIDIENQLQRRALGYVAGAKANSDDVSRAKYLFANLYHDSLDEKDSYYRNLWFFNFYYIDPDQKGWYGWGSDPEALLYALQNKKEGIRSLYEIEKGHPGSVVSEVLLLREMRKVENWLLDENLKAFARIEKPATSPLVDQWAAAKAKNTVPAEPSAWQKIVRFFSGLFGKENPPGVFKTNIYDQSAEKLPAARTLRSEHINDFKEFIHHQLKKGKMRQPVLWQLCAAYLEILQQNESTAREYLERAEKMSPSADFMTQIKVFRILLEINHLKHPVDAEMEQRLASEFDFSTADSKMFKRRGEWISVSLDLLVLIGQKYLAQEDIAKAILCFSYAREDFAAQALIDIYASPQDLLALSNLMSKKKKNNFEQFLLKEFPLNQHHLIEIQATRLMREGKFLEAKKLFEQLPMLYWSGKTEKWDKLETHPQANHFLWMNPIKERLNLNKISFAYHIVSLEYKAKTQPEQADRYYYEMANLFFNTPFWGYNGVVWNGDLTFSMEHYPDGAFPLNVEGFATRMYERRQLFREQYGTRFMARKYYQKVIDVTKNKELKLKAIMLAANCNQRHQDFCYVYPKTENQQQADSVYKAMFQHEVTPELYEKLARECAGVAAFQ